MTISETKMSERLRALVEIESPTGHRAGIGDAYALLESWLNPLLGEPEREVQDGTDHRIWRSSDRPRVMLLGHVDTVWPIGTLERLPFQVVDGRASGPGTFDMKAGLVIIVEALARLASTDGVVVVVTADEEIGSPSSRALIEREAAAVDAVLVLEPSLAGALKTERCGGGIYRVVYRGRAAHAGLEPQNGRNALVELARHVLELRELAAPELRTVVSPTVARAGGATNVIPDHAELNIDVRGWTMKELERVHGAIMARQAVDPDITVEVEGGINRGPMEAHVSAALFDTARRLALQLGQPELTGAAVGGASDGNFTSALGIPTLDGLGPVGDGAHAEHEWASLRSMRERVELVSELVAQLTRDASRAG